MSPTDAGPSIGGMLRRSEATFIAIAALLAACSAAPASPTLSPTPQPTVSSTAQPTPAGTGTAAASPVDITSFLPAGTYAADIPTGLGAAPGTWMMEITPAGITWTNPLNGNVFSPGQIVEVTDSTIVIGADPGCRDQATVTTGTYDWRSDAGNLTFTLQSDSCAGRRDTLATSAWVPVP